MFQLQHTIFQIAFLLGSYFLLRMFLLFSLVSNSLLKLYVPGMMHYMCAIAICLFSVVMTCLDLVESVNSPGSSFYSKSVPLCCCTQHTLSYLSIVHFSG